MPRKGQRGARRPLGNESDTQGFALLAEAYLESLRVRNYSAATIGSREHHLREFIHWAEERGLARPVEVTKPVLERYQRFLYHYRKKNGEPLSFRSQHGCLVPVRSFFKWLCRQNLLLANPAADLELPRAEKRLPRHVLTGAEAEHVLGLPDVTQALGLRDRAILEALYSTGMRRMELLGLKLYDLDRDRGTVFIRQGKGKKDRMIPMGDRAFSWVRRYLEEKRPGCVIAVDFYGFNHQVLGLAAHRSIPSFYYISPQVWASRPARAAKIARLVKEVLVIFPFEEAFFTKSGVNARYVGHPFLEENTVPPSDASWPVKRIVIMPGSRKDEIVRMLPVMVGAKKIISSKINDLEWYVPVAKGLDETFIKGFLDSDIKPVNGIPDADLAMVKSGTASFETAIKGIPEVICYKTSTINYFLARIFVKVECIGMPNIALERKVAPELIQHDFTPERLAVELMRFIEDRELFNNTKEAFQELRQKLQGEKASLMVAEWVKELTKR